MKVPLQDLNAGYQPIRTEIIQAVTQVLDSQHYVLGPKVAELEEKIAPLCGVSYAAGVSSGSDALLLALMALDIGPGDEVITTPFSFFATAGSIIRVSAKPVFVDINPRTFNLDPNKIESALTPNTKAIIPVHLFGQVADMDEILDIAKHKKLSVIEDAAQAIGAKRNSKSAGSFGDASCLSFYPTKNLGGAGDGGMVVTNRQDIAEKVKQLRQHGETSRYQHLKVGINGRLDGIQAAVLLVKLNYLERWTSQRITNAHYYTEQLQNLNGITPPLEENECYHIYHQYVIRCRNRDQLREFLKQQDIGSGVYYPLPLHLQPCFSSLGYKSGQFPEAELAAQEVLALPVYSELTRNQQDTVIAAIKEFSRGLAC